MQKRISTFMGIAWYPVRFLIFLFHDCCTTNLNPWQYLWWYLIQHRCRTFNKLIGAIYSRKEVWLLIYHLTRTHFGIRFLLKHLSSFEILRSNTIHKIIIIILCWKVALILKVKSKRSTVVPSRKTASKALTQFQWWTQIGPIPFSKNPKILVCWKVLLGALGYWIAWICPTGGTESTLIHTLNPEFEMTIFALYFDKQKTKPTQRNCCHSRCQCINFCKYCDSIFCGGCAICCAENSCRSNIYIWEHIEREKCMKTKIKMGKKHTHKPIQHTRLRMHYKFLCTESKLRFYLYNIYVYALWAFH